MSNLLREVEGERMYVQEKRMYVKASHRAWPFNKGNEIFKERKNLRV